MMINNLKTNNDMFKRVSVVMLPTNEKASIFIDTIESGVLIFDKNYMSNTIHWKDVQHQHLYITSDNNIEEGDWHIFNVGCACGVDNTTRDYEACNRKKIIATTDSSLTIKSEQAGDNAWYNPLPKPSDSFITKFIEEYNKGNVITDIMVEYEHCGTQDNGCLGIIECQSTTEGGFYMGYRLKINPKDNTITIKKIKDSWNREEVGFLIDKAIRPFLPYVKEADKDEWLYQWLKQNL